MSSMIIQDEEYRNWIRTLSSRFRSSQIKAASKVNQEMLAFYWSLGKDIIDMKAESRWGSAFISNLSRDLQEALPDVKGFSRTNLFYMIKFYKLYAQAESVPQAEGQNNSGIVPQVEGQFDVPEIFSIPWGHHKAILDKCGDQREKALFYVRETLNNGWSRAVLLNFLDTNLYERQGKAVSNFKSALPAPRGELAQEITKDPYNFAFLTLTKGYYEKELKDALMDNIAKFLLELGTGFAFVGREYRLEVGNTEQFIDMLFYNIRLHCYVVIEVKITSFEPAFMGQIGTYVSAVDGILRAEEDAPTIGLLICKDKDNVLAQYAVNSTNVPVGISEYELSSIIPENFKGTLPEIEEIEAKLGAQAGEGDADGLLDERMGG